MPKQCETMVLSLFPVTGPFASLRVAMHLLLRKMPTHSKGDQAGCSQTSETVHRLARICSLRSILNSRPQLVK